MSWEKVKLGDICESISDGDHLPPPKSVNGIPFVTISNVNSSNQFDFKNTMFVPQEYYEKLDEKRKPRINDILYSVVGSFGNPVFIKENRPFVLRPNESRIHPRYLYYKMLSKDFYMKADAVAVGAAQRTISLTSLRNMEISIPCKDSQKRIADILSAYDNLIENNQKQIKLLEEAAQRLYKQWFIDLRYPGHETTKIVDGLPEGWRKGSIGDIAEFKRGKVITKGDVVEGNVPVVAGGLEPAYYHNASFTESPVITVSGSGANAGFARMYFQKIWASDCSYVDSSATNFIYFTYSFLKENKKSLDSLQKGAAQPHVYAKDINALKLNCPPKDLLVKFEKSVKPLFDKIGKCQNVIEKSKDARDRLLPKLMSKTMEV